MILMRCVRRTTRLILLLEEIVPAFTGISRRRAQEDAEKAVEDYANPPDSFLRSKQATTVENTSSKATKALRKDVTGYLYGGDIATKDEASEKAEKGKKRNEGRRKSQCQRYF